MSFMIRLHVCIPSKVNTIGTVVANNDKCFRYHLSHSHQPKLSHKLEYLKPTNVYLNAYENAKMRTLSQPPVKCTLIRHIRRHIYIDIHSWHCLQGSEEWFIPLLHWSHALSRSPSLNALPAPPTNIDYNNLTLSYNNDSPYKDNVPISTERNGWDALDMSFCN